ncbi:hypothetical protein GW916_03035 [bacterium]|nr:hypothetical protein [bacterium]
MTNRDHAEYLETLGFEARPHLRQGESLTEPSPSDGLPNWDESAGQSPNAPAKAWLFVLDHASQSQPLALELFDKMLGALKLNRDDIETTFARNEGELRERLETHSGYKICVMMGHSYGASLNAPRSFATRSPAECLLNTDLKRPVWETLQEAAKSLHS